VEGGYSIEPGGVDDVDALEGLWLQIHHHHQLVGPQSGTFVDDDASWRVRSACYREWLLEPGSFVLLARCGDELVGYALVRVMPPGPELADTWQVPDPVAELESLLVTGPHRGVGLGDRLLDAVDEELARQGIGELLVGMVPGNDVAQALYERRGFRPRWLLLARSGAPAS
jgi:ribosomal protein S18 acetylase RimI-like enzyme